MIPPILHRVVPERTDDQVEQWWAQFVEMHPSWEHRTWRDPLDPADFPLTSPHWDRCTSGAQLAGLVRLEAVSRHGGFYVDSDCEPFRPLDPLLRLDGVAAWEDRACVPDAVFGANQEHPALDEMIGLAVRRLTGRGRTWQNDRGAWSTGPGVFTTVLPGRTDWLLLGPDAFYPWHYSRIAEDAARDHRVEKPWSFLAHHWHGSWLPEEKRPANR